MEDVFGVEEEDVMREEGGWEIGESPLGSNSERQHTAESPLGSNSVSDADMGACSL
jgi:hypothetical protein